MDELILSWWSWLWNSHNSEDDEYEKLGIDDIIKNRTFTSANITTTATTNSTISSKNHQNNYEIISKVISTAHNRNLNLNKNDLATTTTDNFLEATSKILTKLLKDTSSYPSSSLTSTTTTQKPISSLSIVTKSKGISDQLLSDYSTISGPDLSSVTASSLSDSYVTTQLLPPLLPSSSSSSSSLSPSKLSSSLTTSSSSSTSSLLANFSTISTSTSRTSITSNFLDSLVGVHNNKTVNKNNYRDNNDTNHNHNFNLKINSNLNHQTYITDDQLIENPHHNNDTITFRTLFKDKESITKLLSSDNRNENYDDDDDVNYSNGSNSNVDSDNDNNDIIKEFIKSSKDAITEILSSSSSSSSSSPLSSSSSNSSLTHHQQQQQQNYFPSRYSILMNNNNSSDSSLSSSILDYNYSKILDKSSSLLLSTESAPTSTTSSISLFSTSSSLTSSDTSISSDAIHELDDYKNENLSSIWKTYLMKGSTNYGSVDDDDSNVDNFIENLLNNNNSISISSSSSIGSSSSISNEISLSNNSNISLSSINQTTINTINLEDVYNDTENFLLDIILNCNSGNNSSARNSDGSDNKFNSTTSNSTIGSNFNLYEYCCNFNNRTDIINEISSGGGGGGVGGSAGIISDRINELIGGVITINVGGYNQTVNCTSLWNTLSTSSSSPLITSAIPPSSSSNYFFGTEYDIETVIQLITTFGIAITLGIIILATVIGNVFVIAAILLERNLQSVSNYLILSLAVADLLVACLVMPLSAVYEVSQEWKLGPELCDMWTSSDVLCCTASILHLVAIALDRYWAVTNIDYIHQRTARRIGVMILIIWGLSFLVSVAPLLGWKDPKWDERVSRELKCMVSQDIGYQIFATASSFYVPLLVILILYWRIFQTARKRIRRRQQAAQTHPEPLMANASCLPLTGIGFRWKVTATPPASGGLIATAAGGSGGIAAAVVTVIGRPLPTISETTTAFTNISSTHTSPEKGSYGNGMDRIENDPPTADISTCGGGGGPLAIGHHTTTSKSTTGMLPTTTSIRPKIVRKKTQTSVDSKRERKAAKTLAIITGAFVCCWLPFFALAILLPICQCYIPPVVMSLSLWLGYFNSTLNPIIYTIFSPEFRHAFKRLLCGRRNSIRRQTRCVRR